MIVTTRVLAASAAAGIRFPRWKADRALVLRGAVEAVVTLLAASPAHAAPNAGAAAR